MKKGEEEVEIRAKEKRKWLATVSNDEEKETVDDSSGEEIETGGGKEPKA